MSLKENFCSSPWFHMRINNSGSYEYCRWKIHNPITRVDQAHNIQNQTPLKYFQHTMADIRQTLLAGESPAGCADCKIMEQHEKVSGRQRQLLKIGVLDDHFEQSLLSSPFKPDLDYSNRNQGLTTRTVSDWQIDLGNYCNSACIFCNPESSSSLATEFKKLGLIDHLPPQSWCDDPELLNRFINDLTHSPDLRYLHFIGGETVITPGFKKILSALVQADLAKNIVVGFTTNLTVWSDSVVDLLKQFKQINLGMSVESLTTVNNYVRYPSQLDQVRKILDQWVELGKQQEWLMQLRITPTCLTVHDLPTVYDYAWQNNLAVESCNFLDRPEYLRIGVLPNAQRQQIVQQLKTWIDSHQTDFDKKVINTRDPNKSQAQIVQDAGSYLSYLESADDESHRLPELVKYLKILESNRGNSILTYLPEYEDLFRSAGY